MTVERISINGVRTAMRVAIEKVFCTFETSVVRRVMMDEVEKWSMFEKEKR